MYVIAVWTYDRESERNKVEFMECLQESPHRCKKLNTTKDPRDRKVLWFTGQRKAYDLLANLHYDAKIGKAFEVREIKD